MHAIEVQCLGKAYKRYSNRLGKLREWLFFNGKRYHTLEWVFRDVSFSVKKGESVGIVGQNGAGKSTLLKMLTGTTNPTEGSIVHDGEIAALLELGMGFHGEFSGRQNVYMAGQILGKNTAAIDAVMEDIIEFAEIGDYFDLPVRTYSSGMQVRLAFSVATAFKPDILIVDEALAVGDAYFQHKCFRRIREFRDSGTTLLFVSHDPGAIKTLCDRAILLGEGRVLLDGTPDSVLDYYNALIAERECKTVKIGPRDDQGHCVIRSGTGEARVESVTLLNSKGHACHLLCSLEAARLRICYRAHKVLLDLSLGILIKDRLGNDVFGTNTWHLQEGQVRGVESGDDCVYTLDFCFDELRLGPGSYSVTVALHSEAVHVGENYDWWDRCLVFEVIAGSGPAFIGVAALQPYISVQQTT